MPPLRAQPALSARFRWTSSDVKLLTTGLAAAVCTAAVSSSISTSSTYNESKKNHTAKLEVYLMDRIANKPYLNNPSPVHKLHDPRYHVGGTDNVLGATMSSSRPRGVPTRLRILAIDVPKCKTDAFRDGICQQPSKIFGGATNPLFRDGVARPKQIDHAAINEAQTRKERRELRKPIEQKSLATAIYYCYGKSNSMAAKDSEIDPIVGVEILEASIKSLNPNNIRRTYTSKSAYRYDPGKYSDGKHGFSDNHDEDKERLQRHETDSGIADVEELTEALHEEAADIDSNDIKGRDEKEDSRTAPWNQYAWLEEIHLRINGLVPFNAPVQRSSVISYNLFGRAYQQTVPSSMSLLRWLFPWPLWGSSIRSVEGIDGEGECALYDDSMSESFETGSPKSNRRLNRASNKPQVQLIFTFNFIGENSCSFFSRYTLHSHAVIADGAAMQRVPGSLRFLTKVCRDARVPLYILNDPRSWGRLTSTSYSTLDDALVDLRRTVTDHVVSGALDIREGNAFERGRFVGRWEKELEWQARDAGRKTRQTWVDAKQRWKRERMDDWSELNEDELRTKLAEKKALIGDDCCEGLQKICQSCIKEKREKSTII